MRQVSKKQFFESMNLLDADFEVDRLYPYNSTFTVGSSKVGKVVNFRANCGKIRSKYIVKD